MIDVKNRKMKPRRGIAIKETKLQKLNKNSSINCEHNKQVDDLKLCNNNINRRNDKKTKNREQKENMNKNIVQKVNRSNHSYILRESQNIVSQCPSTRKNIRRNVKTHKNTTKGSLQRNKYKVSKQKSPNYIEVTSNTIEHKDEFKSNEVNGESIFHTQKEHTVAENKYIHKLNESINVNKDVSNKIHDNLLKSCKSTNQRTFPIYRTKFSEESPNYSSKSDLYEFNENISTIEASSQHYYEEPSTILDKKICGKDAGPLEKGAPKKKMYVNIIDDVLRKVMGKVNSRRLDETKYAKTDPSLHLNNAESKKSYQVNNTACTDQSSDTNQKQLNCSGSPWRLNWAVSKPIFISIKRNALPRIDQEMVLDHTLVENFEQSCIKKGKSDQKTVNKQLRQQNILNYLDSNQSQTNIPLERSLFDADMFNSPIKNSARENINMSIDNVKKQVLIASTPVQRRIALDTRIDIARTNTNEILDSDTPLKCYVIKNQNMKYNLRTDSVNNEDNILMGQKVGKKRKASLADDTDEICKRKKSRLEVEKDIWIEQFNKECEDISNYDLHIE